MFAKENNFGVDKADVEQVIPEKISKILEKVKQGRKAKTKVCSGVGQCSWHWDLIPAGTF